MKYNSPIFILLVSGVNINRLCQKAGATSFLRGQCPTFPKPTSKISGKNAFKGLISW